MRRGRREGILPPWKSTEKGQGEMAKPGLRDFHFGISPRFFVQRVQGRWGGERDDLFREERKEERT
jgi:hypothetical protein